MHVYTRVTWDIQAYSEGIWETCARGSAHPRISWYPGYIMITRVTKWGTPDHLMTF